MFALLGRTSVLLYTVDDGAAPRACPCRSSRRCGPGACVVHPDRPELRPVTGPGFRGYRTVDDIVAHVREIAAGGPAIEAERRANEAWARAQFCDPALGTRFHEELRRRAGALALRRGLSPSQVDPVDPTMPCRIGCQIS